MVKQNGSHEDFLSTEYYHHCFKSTSDIQNVNTIHLEVPHYRMHVHMHDL
jgi:hypothetical protein